MAEGFIQVTEGTGKKLRTFDRVVGANTVHSEAVFLDMSPLPTYHSTAGAYSSLGALNHVIQIMAGTTNPVYIARITGWLRAAASALAVGQFALIRLTTAGTGGTAGSFVPWDGTDAATGATVRHNVTASKGTEGSVLSEVQGIMPNALSTSWLDARIFDFDFTVGGRTKMPRIPAGAANGVAVRCNDALTGSLFITATIIELPY